MVVPIVSPRIRGYVSRYRKYLIVGLLCIVLSDASRMIWPWILRDLVNRMEPSASVESVRPVIESLPPGKERDTLIELITGKPPTTRITERQVSNLYDQAGDPRIRTALGELRDRLGSNLVTSDLVRGCLLILLVTIVSAFFLYLVRWNIIRASRFMEYDLRSDFFRHIQRLSPAFFQENPTGDVMSRLVADIGMVRQMIGISCMYISRALVSLTFALVMMFSIDVWTTAVALLPLLILPVATRFLTKRLYTRSKRVHEQLAEISTKAQENLSGIRVVKAYAREKAEIEDFDRLNREYYRRNMSLGYVTGVTFPLFIFGASLGTLAVLGFGGYRYIQGSIDLGTLLALVIYLGMLVWPLGGFGWVLTVIQRGKAAQDRVEAYFERQPLISEPQNPKVPAEPTGEIEFRDLSFRYPVSRNGNGSAPGKTAPAEALQNISLRIPAGRMVAIVGRTGSGKSTLARLPLHLYPVEMQKVFVDGVEIHDWPLAELRRSIGYVSQEPFLFSDTIRNNILLGLESASDEAVAEVMEDSQLAADLDDFPGGLGTLVGERGVTLSGGQKQRAAIARALIVQPRILILDDAFSNVDTQTEEEILRHIRRVRGNHTTILISHRISTVSAADDIVVLDKGRIVERGRHNDLVRLGGIYADLHQKQMLEETIESED